MENRDKITLILTWQLPLFPPLVHKMSSVIVRLYRLMAVLQASTEVTSIALLTSRNTGLVYFDLSVSPQPIIFLCISCRYVSSTIYHKPMHIYHQMAGYCRALGFEVFDQRQKAN